MKSHVCEMYNVQRNHSPNEMYADEEFENEEFANAGGVVGSIADAVGAGAQLGGKIADNAHAKKYGAQDSLQKSKDAKAQLMQSVMNQRQADIDAKAKASESKGKTLRYALIGGSVVIGLAILGYVMYKRSKK